jgi:Predicted transcriptional regulators
VRSLLYDICKKIKKFRKKAGYTQQQIANLLNIDRSTYSYYESGRTIPDLKTLFKLAEIFQEPLINLLSSEENSLNFSDFKDQDFDNEILENDNIEPSEITEPHDTDEKTSDTNNKPQSNDEKYPKYSVDLTDLEKEIIICFRMLSYASQIKLKKSINRLLKNEGVFR